MPKLPPCTKGLPHFKKKGCPQKEFDSETGKGCTLWKVRSYPDPEDKDREKIKVGKCTEEWLYYFTFDILVCSQGNQHATESFKNGMLEKDAHGNIVPKGDPNFKAFLQAINQQNKNLLS